MTNRPYKAIFGQIMVLLACVLGMLKHRGQADGVFWLSLLVFCLMASALLSQAWAGWKQRRTPAGLPEKAL